LAPSHIRVSRQGLIVTASDDSTVRIWDGNTSKQRCVHQFDNSVAGVAVSPDGNLVATSSLDDTLRLFAIDNGRQIYRLPGHGGFTRGVADLRRTLVFASDDRRLLSFGSDWYLRAWELRTGRALLEHAIRPSGVKIPDPEADDFDIRREPISREGLGSPALSPDGKTLVVDIVGEYRFFDVATGKEMRTLTHGGGSFFEDAIAVSPNGKYLLASQYAQSGENTHHICLRKWTGDIRAKITLPGRKSGAVAFSADSRSFAAVAGESDEIRLFETAGGHERGRIRGFPGSVRSLAFFPDGRLASGMSDSTVLIWELPAAAKEAASK
jgi:WD40 repeat protein